MTAEQPSGVRVEVAGAVATIEFSSPGRRNAWDPVMDAAYVEALAQVERDVAVRVVVLRGADGHFCPGRALGGLRSSGAPSGRLEQSHGIDRTREVRKPVIAAIHGSCAGIGLTLALLCDVRFAARTAMFSTAFVRRGLVAGHGTSWLLGRAVGQAHAAELLLSGRKLDGTEAERLGLVHRALPPAEVDGHVSAYAGELAAQCSPRSMEVIKAQLREDQERSYAQALAASVRLAEEAFTGPDVEEGVRSYQDRRPPRFTALAPPADAQQQPSRSGATR